MGTGFIYLRDHLIKFLKSCRLTNIAHISFKTLIQIIILMFIINCKWISTDLVLKFELNKYYQNQAYA